MSDLSALHNRLSREILRLLAQPLVQGGTPKDVMILTESMICGVILLLAKPGGADPLLDALVAGVRKRLAEIELEAARPAGRA